NSQGTYPLQLLEDVNKVAFKCLEERMLVELSKALVRVAVKKVEEAELRKNNDQLGSLLGVFNAITEKADTRNWQTLPHTISYARVPLSTGSNDVTFKRVTTGGQEQVNTFHYTAEKGKTLFHTFTSLESHYPSY
ncbi:MAG: hypothetical protein K1X47_07765, partial [Cyclobacteriaceae bacterium]|nr:hypothetical protein [Cyclobacteriaceae bacterium]